MSIKVKLEESDNKVSNDTNLAADCDVGLAGVEVGRNGGVVVTRRWFSLPWFVKDKTSACVACVEQSSAYLSKFE